MTTLPLCKFAATTKLESAQGSSQRIFYRSADRRTLAGVFEESGKVEVTYTYTEFLVVLCGTAKCRIKGGAEFTLQAGDAAVLIPGQTIQFDLSEDFRDVAFMVGDTALPH